MGYFKDIDLNNDKEVLKFLKEHDTHIINGDIIPYACYSNNIKIYNLDVDENTKDFFYELLQIKDASYIASDIFNDITKDFEKQHDGYQIEVVGRSGGHLMLSYKNKFTYYKQITAPKQLTKDKRVKLAKVLMDFDKACDNIIKGLASLTDKYEIEENEITIIKKVKTLVLKEE
jgi:hypothetical protein